MSRQCDKAELNDREIALNPLSFWAGILNTLEKAKIYSRKCSDGIIFKVYVQPKSSKNVVVGQHRDALKIKLTAPPVDNAANRMCIKFLAQQLDVPKSAIEIIAGHASRHKQVLVRYSGTDADHIEHWRLKQRISNLLSDD